MEKTKKTSYYFSDYAICSDYEAKAGVAGVYGQSKPQQPFLKPAQQVMISLTDTTEQEVIL